MIELRQAIKKCFGDTKMPEDDQFEPDVELFDIEETINRLTKLIDTACVEARKSEIERLEFVIDNTLASTNQEFNYTLFATAIKLRKVELTNQEKSIDND